MFRLLTFLLLCFGATATFAQNIDELILKSDYDAALQLIDRQLGSNMDQPLLLYKKGIVLGKKYDYVEALKSFDRAWILDTTNLQVLNELAEVQTVLGNHKHALPYYKLLYRRDTANAVNAVRLARAYFNLRSYREPYQLLLGIFKRDSNNLYVNKQLAFSAARSGHDSLAIALYNRIIGLNPSDLNNYNSLIAIYQRKELFDKAIETAEKGLSIFPEETMLINKLGDLHYAKRDHSSAIAPYEKFLSFGDSIQDVVKNLGICYYYAKRYDEGRYLLERSLAMRPNDPVAGLFTGLCYKELNELDEGISYLSFASKIAIPYYMADIYNQWGNICLQKQEYKEAVSLMKKAYRLDSTKCEILFRIGNTYDVWQKDKSQAVRYYNTYLGSPKESNEMHRKLTEYVMERKKKLHAK